MVTALANTDIKDVPKLFSDCNFLTKKIAESIPEAYLRKLEYDFKNKDSNVNRMKLDSTRNEYWEKLKK